jgi:hypothetical protein
MAQPANGGGGGVAPYFAFLRLPLFSSARIPVQFNRHSLIEPKARAAAYPTTGFAKQSIMAPQNGFAHNNTWLEFNTRVKHAWRSLNSFIGNLCFDPRVGEDSIYVRCAQCMFRQRN